MKTQTLYKKEGTADKYYTASISDDGVVQFAWGPRGQVCRHPITLGPFSPEEAEKVYSKKLNEKLRDRYVPGDPITPLETVGFTPSASPSKLRLVPPSPMLLKEITQEELVVLAGDSDWYFQKKHDGDRLRLVKSGASLIGYSRTDHERTDFPKPIITAAMSCPDFLLDGEIVGGTIWAFDLLSVYGEDLTAIPYVDRLRKLHDLFQSWPHGGIVVVESATTPKAKVKLVGDVRAEGGEGIVAKKASAPHSAGKSHGAAFKFKFCPSASVIVASQNVQSSFNMKLYDGTDLGRCTISKGERPPVGAVVEVRYLNVSRGGSLYQPRLLGIRHDIAPEECTIDQLEFKGEAR